MDVECPKCGTIFEFDEAQMRSAVATLKCSVCAHMFRIHTDGAGQGKESQRRWMVRHRATGDVHYFTGFAELHHMIMGGKTTRRDEISRTGDKWVELEQMGEFVPVFQAIESIERLTRGEEAPEVPGLSELSVAEPERPRGRTIQQFAASSPRPASASAPTPTPAPAPAPRHSAPSDAPRRLREMPPRPARMSEPVAEAPARRPERAERRSQESESVVEDQWSLGDMASTTTSMAVYEGSEAPKKSRVGAWVALLCVCVVGAGGAYAWFYERDMVTSWLESRGGTPAVARVDEGGVDGGVSDRGGEGTEGDERYEASRVVGRARGAAEEESREVFGRSVAEVAVRGSGEVAMAVAAAAKKAKRTGARSDVGAMLKSARRALARGQKERAKEGFGRVMELDPGNVVAITGLGWSLLAMGRLDSAIAQFKRALHFDPSHGDAYIGLGKAERRRGNLEGALNAYERYLGAYPSGRQASIASHQRDELKRALGH